MFAIRTSHYREQVSIQACGELIASYDITNARIAARYLSTRLFTFRVTRSHSSVTYLLREKTPCQYLLTVTSLTIQIGSDKTL